MGEHRKTRKEKDQTTRLSEVVFSVVFFCRDTESMKVGFLCREPFVEAVVEFQWGESQQEPWNI